MATRVDPPRSARARRTQDARLFQLLVDSVVDYAIFLLTPQGHVASWNRGAERLKGYAPEEIIGHSFERFYTPEDRVAGRPGRLLASARANGRVEDEGWRVKKDGSRFWADVVITALRDESGRLVGFAKVTRDLTERRRAEQERARRLAAERAAERIDRLQGATAALAAASRPQQAAEVLADVGVTALGAAAGAVAFPTPSGEELAVAYARGDEPRTLRTGELLGRDDPLPLVHAWRTGRPIFLGSREQVPADYPDLAPLLARSSYRAWAAVPLTRDQRVVGVLGVTFDRPRGLDPDERGFLLALAEVGAQTIDRARIYESEQRARAEAEAAVHAQDEFLSIASHELRTPVAAVKATAQLAQRVIQRGRGDLAKTNGYLERITRAADRLGTLVDDLLDVSRLRTGQLRLRPESLDLAALASEIVGRYQATEPGHQFQLSLPAGEALVHADSVRLEQVLDNLLSNAVKYSPAGGPITVEVTPAGAGISLTVTDQGIGLPFGHATRIFEVFGRAPNATAQQIPGLGLGLAICRQLIEAHGGRMWATSQGEQQGSTFGIWLPGAAAAQEEASA